MVATTNPRSVLIVAYHFPPVAQSSGVHRMVALANAMAAQKWQVKVLSASERTYERINRESMSQLDPSVHIVRAQAFDTAKHLSIKGKYLQLMALPDKLQSWIPFGVIRGLREIRRQRPDLILSTYPIASAHIIGLLLSRISGIPWVADFRDPMAQPGYPSDPLKWKLFSWIERSAAKYAARLVFATPGALAEYQQRYPQVAADRWLLVTNGYDESQYQSMQPQPRHDGEIRIVHSGLIYIHERNPRALFEALSSLKADSFFDSRKFRLVLRACGHEETYAGWISELGIEHLVELAPQVPYRQALQEMFDADGLLLMQGGGCNQQIPAKAYEYLRAQKPVLALTDKAGDTAKLFNRHQIARIAPMDDALLIATEFKLFIGMLEVDTVNMPDLALIEHYDRSNLSKAWIADLAGVTE